MADILAVFNGGKPPAFSPADLAAGVSPGYPAPLARATPFLRQAVFNRHHSETEMLRYMRRLEARDLSLTTSMIPLGSCTMKLNGTAEMLPVSWPELARLHPFAPCAPDARLAGPFPATGGVAGGDHRFCRRVPSSPIPARRANTPACSSSANTTKPAARPRRNVCLIPASAHGTNPASAAMAGLKIVPVACDAQRQH